MKMVCRRVVKHLRTKSCCCEMEVLGCESGEWVEIGRGSGEELGEGVGLGWGLGGGGGTELNSRGQGTTVR
jgi:hypothetical protein